MSLKIVFVICAHMLLIQRISAQCIGPIGVPWAVPCAGAWGAPCAASEWSYIPVATLAASNGPGVAVATASPLIPDGVSVLSENAYAGDLTVTGALPFLGTVALEGVLPTAGAGAVAYGCSNGAIGITAEDIGAVGFDGIAGPRGYWPGLAGPLGYGSSLVGSIGFGGLGCGCNPIEVIE